MPNPDTQKTEIIGRNVLINQLLAADLEVALPLRDRGVDLIACAEIGGQQGSFRARPIQLKTCSKTGFLILRKYERISDLLIVFVWYVAEPRECAIYGLSYAESLTVADQMGWTDTPSWAKGAYTTTRPGKKLVGLLEPFLVDRDRWRKLVLGAVDGR